MSRRDIRSILLHFLPGYSVSTDSKSTRSSQIRRIYRPAELEWFLYVYPTVCTANEIWMALLQILRSKEITADVAKAFLQKFIAVFDLTITNEKDRLVLRKLLYDILYYYTRTDKDVAFRNFIKLAILRSHAQLPVSLSYQKVPSRADNEFIHLRNYWTSESLADEFCIIAKDMVRNIGLCELSKTLVRQPGVRRAIEIFNRISYLISRDILMGSDVDAALDAVKYYIRVAQQLHLKRNYDILAVITSSFSRWQIDRLKNMWSKLSAKKRERIALLSNVVSSNNNYAIYRSEISSLPPDTRYIPLISLLIRDLIHISEANSRVLPDGSINLDRIYMMGRSIGIINAARGAYPEMEKSSPLLRRLVYEGNSYDDDTLAIHSYTLYPNPNSVQTTDASGNHVLTPLDVTLPTNYQNFEIPFQGPIESALVEEVKKYTPNNGSDYEKSLRYYLISFRDMRRWTPYDVSLWLEKYRISEDIITKLLTSNVSGHDLFAVGRSSYSFLGFRTNTYERLERLVHLTVTEHCKYANEIRTTQANRSIYPPLLKIAAWTRYDVAAWLAFSGLDQVKDRFLSRGIDGHQLFLLTQEEIAKLGVPEEYVDRVVGLGKEIGASNVLYRVNSN